MNRFAFIFTAALAATLLAGAPAVGADGIEKPGKKARITLTSDVRIGDIVLMAGDYTVQCRERDSDRVMHFKRDGRAKASKSGAISEGTVPCRTEALSQKASRTAVRLQTDGEVPRVTRIEFAGEDMAHLL
jgi:hypothetical protein